MGFAALNPSYRLNRNNLKQFCKARRNRFKERGDIEAAMTRSLILVIALVVSGGAQAATPAFDSEHFCAGFVENNASGNMGEMAKAVCLLSEESTKSVVDKAWSHASADGQAACLKAAGESYVILAHCLSSLPGQ
jgi:hypothetical protein